MPSEDYFQSIVEYANDAIYSYDLQGNLLTWNKSCEKIYGYSSSEILGQNIRLIIPEYKLQEYRKLQQSILWEEPVKDYQTERRHKNGSIICVSINLSPLKDEHGKIFGISGIARKVEERRKAEAKAVALLESAPDAMVIVNKFGQIVLVNAQTEKLFGFSREELIGQEVEILIPERYRPQHSKHRGIFFHHPKSRGMGEGRELYGIKKDGTEFAVEISLSPLEVEEGIFTSAAIRDITGRRKEEQKFRGLLESAPDAMVIVDKRGVIQLVNSQTEKLFGFKREELIGQKVEMLIPDEYRSDHPDSRTNYFHDPRFRSMGVGLELYGKTKSGGKLPVEISLSPIESEDGLFVAAAIRDITLQKKAAQELKDYATQLEISNKELESFTYVASHDLKEPLRKVNTFISMLLSGNNVSLPDHVTNYLEKIAISVKQMQGLINDLLEFSRIINVQEEAEVVDLNVVLSELLKNLEEVIQEKQATISSTSLPMVQAVPFQMQQVFQNIILNSLKYSRSGVVPEIRISCSKEEDFYTFNFADNGIGFDPQFASKIFEPFQRLHAKNQYSGTGIGLAICKKIIEKHNGKIFAISQPHKGTTITIHLPASLEQHKTEMATT